MSAPLDASQAPGAPPRATESPGSARPSRPAAGGRTIDGPEFQGLLRLKRRTVGPMLAGGLGVFIVVLALAGTARPLMVEKVVGPLNLGYVLVLALYVLCWMLAVLYAFLAGTRFDPQADRAVAEREARS